MARRLPWATVTDAIDRAKARSAPAPRGRHEKPAMSDEDMATEPKLDQASSPMKLPQKARVRKRETSRTPSMSPPPAPPPAEFMHEGYYADDIFMMVEDEFQAVAQTFTHHLHHAEYVRMKKKARTAPPKAISQPLNSMHAEAKKNLEAKNLHERQNFAVKSMIPKTGRSSPDDEEEARGNDSWQGTSLAGLMAKDSSKKRTALVGLQQIPSATRAAKGFGRGEGDSPTKRDENRSIPEISGGKSRSERTASLAVSSPIEESEEYRDDDPNEPLRTKAVTKGKLTGLDIREPLNKVLHDPVNPSRTLNAPPLRSNSGSEDVTKTKIGSNNSRESSKPSPSSLRRTIASFDDFHDEDSNEVTTRSNGVFSNISTPRSKDKRTKEKDKRSRLNEIPTFLV